MEKTPLKLGKRNTGQELLSIPPSPFLEKLGYGTGVNVWKLNHSQNNISHSPWAIKNVRKNCSDHLSNKFETLINKEAKILKSLNHENIIGFRGFLKSDDGRNCLAMEIGGESLGDMIEKRCENDLGPFPADMVLKVALSIAKALKYLHEEKNILHGDLKSYNVVIKNDFKDIKLCDFGVSLDLNDKDLCKNYIGTPIYSAPECQEGIDEPITAKADIFSLGLVLWEMLALTPPHVEDLMCDETFAESQLETSQLDSDDSLFTNVSTNHSIQENYGTRPPLPPDELGPEYNPVIEIFYSCTEQNPEKRPTAASLVEYIESLLQKNDIL